MDLIRGRFVEVMRNVVAGFVLVLMLGLEVSVGVGGLFVRMDWYV